MLSILIPTYNYNVTNLANELHQQAMGSLVDFEIIVMEDGSTLFLEENNKLCDLPYCKYIVLKENIGRAMIRNRLAEQAKYGHLLFLDCDGAIDNKYFIHKYLAFCHEECVVLGGRIYHENVDPKYSLLHKYGTERERNDTENLKERKKHPIFTSPNFLISKSIFTKIRFDESIKGYGHEDTVFGIMLERAAVEFKYIDNPIVHTGIEDNPTFISKTEKALANLYLLYKSGKYPELGKKSKILSLYVKVERFYLKTPLKILYRISAKAIMKNLLSPNPSLYLFDFYKMGVLCSFPNQDLKQK